MTDKTVTVLTEETASLVTLEAPVADASEMLEQVVLELEKDKDDLLEEKDKIEKLYDIEVQDHNDTTKRAIAADNALIDCWAILQAIGNFERPEHICDRYPTGLDFITAMTGAIMRTDAAKARAVQRAKRSN